MLQIHKMHRGFLPSFVFVAFLLLLTIAVQSATAYQFPYEFEGKSVPNARALVFGQIKVTKGDEVVKWSDSMFAHLSTGIPYVFLLPEGTSIAKGYRLTKDGFFCWQLPPGTYVLSGFKLRSGAADFSVRIFATFNVPSASSLLYIGTLNLAFKGGYHFSIEDEFAEASERLKVDFPTITTEPIKTLLQLEEEP
jgi:hypothetical protein